MKYVPAIAMVAALALTVSVAHAAKYHKRHTRHTRAPAVVAPAPSWSVGPATRMGPPDPYRCYQDEGYGRWTLCGQGTPGS
jgi:hypothetical protein